MSFMSTVVEVSLMIKIAFYRGICKITAGFKKLISRRKYFRQFQSKIEQMKHRTPRAPKARAVRQQDLEQRFIEEKRFEEKKKDKLLIPEKTESIALAPIVLNGSD